MPRKTYHFVCPEYSKMLQTRKPTPEEIAGIKPGGWVKLWDNEEGFFVKVTAFNGKMIKGIVDNDLVHKHDFKCGDELEFTVESVTEVVL